MSEHIVPTESLISFRRGGPRRHSEPIARASVSSVKAEDVGLAARDFILIAGATVLLAGMGLLYLVQAAEITSVSYRVHQVRSEVQRLEQENSVLAVDIASLERLDRVQSEAESMGFTGATSLHYLRLERQDGALAQSPAPGP